MFLLLVKCFYPRKKLEAEFVTVLTNYTSISTRGRRSRCVKQDVVYVLHHSNFLASFSKYARKRVSVEQTQTQKEIGKKQYIPNTTLAHIHTHMHIQHACMPFKSTNLQTHYTNWPITRVITWRQIFAYL